MWRTSRKYTMFILVYGRVLIEAYLFKSFEEDEECVYDHTFIDDSSA